MIKEGRRSQALKHDEPKASLQPLLLRLCSVSIACDRFELAPARRTQQGHHGPARQHRDRWGERADRPVQHMNRGEPVVIIDHGLRVQSDRPSSAVERLAEEQLEAPIRGGSKVLLEDQFGGRLHSG